MKQGLVDFLVSPVEVLGLSAGVENKLKRADITSVIRLIAHEGGELKPLMFDFGPKKLQETEAALLKHNLRLGLAKDYKEQILRLGPDQPDALRDIATCFTREFQPDARATLEDKETLVAVMMDPLKARLMKAFSPAELQNPETSAMIEESFDTAIRMAQAKIQAMRP